MSALDSGRYSVAAGAVGVAQACIDASVQYATTRKAFGKPIAGHQLVQELIADMVVETEAARLLVWRAGALKDKGRPNTRETSIAKLYDSEAAQRAADNAIQIHGGYGFSDEFPVERYWRDARVNRLYEGTTQIQKLIVGRFATGSTRSADGLGRERRRRAGDALPDGPGDDPGARTVRGARRERGGRGGARRRERDRRRRGPRLDPHDSARAAQRPGRGHRGPGSRARALRG